MDDSTQFRPLVKRHPMSRAKPLDNSQPRNLASFILFHLVTS